MKEPWGAATMAPTETNHGVCALLPPLHSLKPSDACSPALTRQSQLGDGRWVSYKACLYITRKQQFVCFFKDTLEYC